MRILQVNATYGTGSTGTIMADIHNLLMKNGDDSFVAYSSANISDNNIINGYKIGGVFGKKIHALLCRVCGRQAYFSRFATRRFIKYVKKIKPDTVHLHNLHSNYINLNMLLRFLANEDIRTVITLHDCWLFTGGCFNFASSECNRWQKKCGNCPRRFTDTPAILRDCSAKILKDRKKYLGDIKRLDVVGVSDWVAGEAAMSFLKEKNITRIYNGIDLQFFRPVLTDLKEKLNIKDKFVILGIANKWLKEINRELLENLCKALKDDMVFLLVGADKTDKLPDSDKIITLPFIKSREEMREIYSSCDVFANCTREDTFSLVNAEAQACGTPVVVFDNTGAKETVSDKFGIKVETGNTVGFVEGINTVYKNKKESYSEGCIEFVKANFDKTNNLQEYVKLYEGGGKNE